MFRDNSFFIPVEHPLEKFYNAFPGVFQNFPDIDEIFD